jgi:periplasmic divalent cation tolerance protein
MEDTEDARGLLIWTNLPDRPAAEAMARSLVERRLAACVNILPAVQSVYRWQGAIEEATESSLLIKTSSARYAELEQAIKDMHPYELPEIIALPIQAGLPAYLEWLLQETNKG